MNVNDMSIKGTDEIWNCVFYFFFFKQKTAYEMSASLVGSEMCIRDRTTRVSPHCFGIMFLNLYFPPFYHEASIH